MAATSLSVLVALASSSPGPAHADDARDCVQARDAATSIKACTELIRQQPANIVAYNHRGNGHRAAGNYDAAVADFTKAIQIDSAFAPAYNGRCAAFTLKGDYDAAIADCSKAVELNPEVRSRVLQSRHRPADARATSSAPLPTTARRSPSTPSTPRPTTAAPGRT